jgi:hypothetical protein
MLVKSILDPQINITLKNIGRQCLIGDRMAIQKMLHNAIFNRSKTNLLIIKNNNSRLMQQMNGTRMKGIDRILTIRYSTPHFLMTHSSLSTEEHKELQRFAPHYASFARSCTQTEAIQHPYTTHTLPIQFSYTSYELEHRFQFIAYLRSNMSLHKKDNRQKRKDLDSRHNYRTSSIKFLGHAPLHRIYEPYQTNLHPQTQRGVRA